ncbi:MULTISPECIES: magnesium chelatase domain-containing protein [Streptomyces]|uniref:Magnesium chelatase domain-containing protein n=1 Tax=Streptomyces sp. 900129855 TaxID=3155129 RepID=A0ABV2ZZ66_9ACTN
MASIARPTRIGVISDGVLTEDGNPFNLKYAVLTAEPGDVLEDVTTPNYVVGDALYRTGLVVDADQRGLGIAWPVELSIPGQGRAQVRAAGESAAVIHATVGPGPNWFTISGVSYERETMDRVRAGIINGGYDWPEGRVTVTVETVTGRPLDASHDLAIVCAILGADGHYSQNALTNRAFIGELGLDGRVRPVSDVNEAVRSAIANGCTIAFVADDDLTTLDVAGIGIYGVENLHQTVTTLSGFDLTNS